MRKDFLVGENSQNVDALKQHMDVMFSFASKVSYSENHLLRVIQASKSLIGMDLNHPPRSLLKWLDDYVKNFTPNFNPPSLSDQNTSPETITYPHLEQLILNKQEIESNMYLTYLLQVADPQHIAEFLMELSAKKSPGSFLLCWSVFRSIQFLGDKQGYPLLYLCLSKLLEKEGDKKDNVKLPLEKFELYCHQFQIRETAFIRKNKIIPHLDKIIQPIALELSNTSPSFIPIALGSIIRIEGEQGIISYLSAMEKEAISAKMILLLDALRSALKFSNNSKDSVLLSFFDNHCENEYAK